MRMGWWVFLLRGKGQERLGMTSPLGVTPLQGAFV